MSAPGQPTQLPVSRIRTSWGYSGGLRLASAPGDFDLYICGETREWEMVEYVQDHFGTDAREAD